MCWVLDGGLSCCFLVRGLFPLGLWGGGSAAAGCWLPACNVVREKFTRLSISHVLLHCLGISHFLFLFLLVSLFFLCLRHFGCLFRPDHLAVIESENESIGAPTGGQIFELYREESCRFGDVKEQPDPVRNGPRNGHRKSELLPFGR